MSLSARTAAAGQDDEDSAAEPSSDEESDEDRQPGKCEGCRTKCARDHSCPRCLAVLRDPSRPLLERIVAGGCFLPVIRAFPPGSKPEIGHLSFESRKKGVYVWALVAEPDTREGWLMRRERSWDGLLTAEAVRDNTEITVKLKPVNHVAEKNATLHLELKDDGRLKGELLPPAYNGLNQSGGKSRVRVRPVYFTAWCGALPRETLRGHREEGTDELHTAEEVERAEEERADAEADARDERRAALQLPTSFDVEYDGFGGARMVGQDGKYLSDFDSGDEERFAMLTGQTKERKGADWSGRGGYRCDVCGRRSENVGPRRGFDYSISMCGGCTELSEPEDGGEDDGVEDSDEDSDDESQCFDSDDGY